MFHPTTAQPLLCMCLFDDLHACIIIASAASLGLQPRVAELLAWPEFGVALAAVQSGPAGIMYYGLFVFLMGFLPFGGIQPKEIAEYFNTVGVLVLLGAVMCSAMLAC